MRLTAPARRCIRGHALLRAPGSWQRRTQMDAIILVAVAFFALAIAYAYGCDRM
jgi:hypothetical protein